MRRTEGPAPDQRMLRGQKAHDGMDLGDLQRLLPGHIRQDRRQALAQHTFTGTGRPHQKHIVRAGGGDLQGPLDVFLALDIGKVRKVLRCLLRCPLGLRLDEGLALQMGHKLCHIFHRNDGDALGKCRLPRVFLRDIEGLKAVFLRRNGHGQHAVDAPELPLKAQLPEKGRLFPGRPAHLRCDQNIQQDRQIVEGPALFRIGGRQIQGNAADGKFEAAVLYGGADPLPGLLDRSVRQAHDVKARQSAGNKALHRHGIPADAVQAQRIQVRNHSHSSFFSDVIIQ